MRFKRRLKNNKVFFVVILFTTAIIWGSSFIAMSQGGNIIPPLAFNGLRQITGACFILIICIIRQAFFKKYRFFF